MSGNRKKAEKQLLEDIEAILPGSPNKALYEEMFAGMSDKDFDVFVQKVETGEVIPPIIVPNLNEHKLDIQRNLDLAKKWGHNFFERVWLGGYDGIPRYLSNVPYLIIDMPVRRQAQLLTKKISIPENNKSIDDFTGQPTGASKGSKISQPETQIMAALGLDNNLMEFLKIRGGDVESFNASNRFISKTGSVSLAAIEPYGGKVRSTQTLKTLLTAMHFQVSGI